jgi:four helix bundle protein
LTIDDWRLSNEQHRHSEDWRLTIGEWQSGHEMDSAELLARTRDFALSVIRLSARLPRATGTQVITSQLMRSATSVGANYRAACRARSRADFIAKMSIVEEEADESAYWLELLAATQPKPGADIEALWQEASELVAIAVASKKTAKAAERSS